MLAASEAVKLEREFRMLLKLSAPVEPKFFKISVLEENPATVFISFFNEEILFSDECVYVCRLLFLPLEFDKIKRKREDC